MLSLLLSITVQTAPATELRVPAPPLPKVCIHAGRCGECYNTGEAGTRSADNLNCTPCEYVKPGQIIADREGLLEPKASNYIPPDHGGPGSSVGSGTRQH